jgi:hypothetical protein
MAAPGGRFVRLGPAVTASDDAADGGIDEVVGAAAAGVVGAGEVGVVRGGGGGPTRRAAAGGARDTLAATLGTTDGVDEDEGGGMLTDETNGGGVVTGPLRSGGGPRLDAGGPTVTLGVGVGVDVDAGGGEVTGATDTAGCFEGGGGATLLAVILLVLDVVDDDVGGWNAFFPSFAGGLRRGTPGAALSDGKNGGGRMGSEGASGSLVIPAFVGLYALPFGLVGLIHSLLVGDVSSSMVVGGGMYDSTITSSTNDCPFLPRIC